METLGQVDGTTPKPKPNLITKLNEIVAAVDHVEKGGFNEFSKYKYVKAADLARAVRKELADRNVLMLTTVLKVSRGTYPAREGNMNLIDLELGYAFQDGDGALERLPAEGWFMALGEGADKGDKSSYKAMTGAMKYALRNAFLVPDEADPEADETTDKEAGKAAAAAVAQRKVAAAKGNSPYSVCLFLSRDVLADSGPVLRMAGAPLKDKDFREVLTEQCFAWPDEKGLDGMVITEAYEDLLNEICKAKGITLLDKSSAPAGGAAVSSPSPQATAAPLITDYKQPAGQKFAVVVWNGMECSCWDAALWPFLKIAKGKPAELDIQDKPKGDKVYHNVVGIRTLGGKKFDMEAKNFEIQRGES